MKLPDGFLDEIRDRLTVSGVVGRHVRLQRRGREFVGLSPFNKEKTPSFTVNDQKGFYHCFSSGEHGDIFTFLMKTQGLDFREAVERLAAEAGLEMPRQTAADREKEDRRQRLFAVVASAAAYYADRLATRDGEAARAYLAGRGVGAEAIAAFRLGYAPRGRGLIEHLEQAGFPLDLQIEAGLVRRPDDGREPFVFLRDRLIFPVVDSGGRPVAFGGRIMTGEGPKYVNSPETPIFAKGQLLYGYDKARAAAHQGHHVVVAEGYMDVISLHQAGFRGAVAPLGTALGEPQAEALWRLSELPVLCFDGDNAGRKAAWRTAQRVVPLLRPDHSMRFAFLPDGEDPDSLVRGQGPGPFGEILAAAVPLAELAWQTEQQSHSLTTPEGKAGFLRGLMTLAGTIRDPEVQKLYRDEFSRRFEQDFRGGGGRDVSARGRAGRGRKAGFGAAWPMRAGGRGRELAPIPGPMPNRPVRLRSDDALSRILITALVNHPEMIEAWGEILATLSPKAPEVAALQRSLIDLMRPGAGHDSLDIPAGGLDSARVRSQFEQAGLGAALSHLMGDSTLAMISWLRPGADRADLEEGLAEQLLLHQADRLAQEARHAGEAAAREPSGAVIDYLGRLGLACGELGEDEREDA